MDNVVETDSVGEVLFWACAAALLMAAAILCLVGLTEMAAALLRVIHRKGFRS